MFQVIRVENIVAAALPEIAIPAHESFVRQD
jgi:hypothetical protein